MSPADQESEDNVKIYAPDRTLQTKVGAANLDVLLSPKVVAEAQSVIQQLSDQFLEESLLKLKDLEKINTQIQSAPETADQFLQPVIDTAFSLKTQAGLAEYELVSALAKSLHLHCEQLNGTLGAKNITIIQWHVGTLSSLLNARMKGDGGEIGKAIITELERLRPTEAS